MRNIKAHELPSLTSLEECKQDIMEDIADYSNGFQETLKALNKLIDAKQTGGTLTYDDFCNLTADISASPDNGDITGNLECDLEELLELVQNEEPDEPETAPAPTTGVPPKQHNGQGFFEGYHVGF